MSGIKCYVPQKLNLKTAVHYALSVLDVMAPHLLRPAASRNIVAIVQSRHKDVQLPNLDDVRQLVLQGNAAAIRENHVVQKLTLKIAVHYVMNLLTLVASNLMRPLATHNIAAIERRHYKNVQLPDLDDVRKQVLQQVSHRK
jgi:hypothetical protein